MVDFDRAMEILAGPPMGQAVAMAIGVHPGTVSRGRMSSVNGRTAPKGWQKAVRSLAEERAAALSALAAELADA